MLLGYTKGWKAWSGIEEPKVAFSQHLQILELVENLDPCSKNVKIYKFSINQWYQWDWDKLQDDIDNGIPSKHGLANYYSILGQHEKAIKFREESLKDDPRNTMYQYTGIWNLFNAREFDRALEALANLKTSFPESGFHFMVSEAYYYQGLYQKSLEAYEFALSINDVSRQPFHNKSIYIACLANTGRTSEARGNFLKCWK